MSTVPALPALQNPKRGVGWKAPNPPNLFGGGGGVLIKSSHEHLAFGLQLSSRFKNSGRFGVIAWLGHTRSHPTCSEAPQHESSHRFPHMNLPGWKNPPRLELCLTCNANKPQSDEEQKVEQKLKPQPAQTRFCHEAAKHAPCGGRGVHMGAWGVGYRGAAAHAITETRPQ